MSVLKTAVTGLAMIAFLSACSSDSGQKTGNSNPPPVVEGEFSSDVQYDGPDPATSDITNFKTAFWNNVASTGVGCGGCHSVEGATSPQFARSDDINLAYAAANSVVNLNDPAASALVEKVAGGHNCWSGDTGLCEEKLTEWITNWATESGVEVTQAALKKPDAFDVSASLVFPEDASGFAPVHSLFTQYCADCHRADAPQAPVQPYFASANADAALAAAQTKMLFNVTEVADGDPLIDASRSRLVLRLREEAHNCWNNNCVTASSEMEAALETYASSMDYVGLDDTLVTSKAMRIGDGTAISQGGRIETNAIAVYPFKKGSGGTVSDYAFDKFPPAMDLTISGLEDESIQWVSNWGLRINDAAGRIQSDPATTSKLKRYISQTGEYSVEAWVVPANVTQEGPARIVSYSAGDDLRNFTLGQTLYNYNLFNRSKVTDGNGGPMISTEDAAEVLQATLQHVVMNYDVAGGRKLYVNGDLVVAEDPAGGGDINEWDESFALYLGNEASGQYPWRGTIRFLAIHNRTLSAEDVMANYDVGVGQKILVAFAIDHLISDMSDAYIVFQIEQFDDYSYLFSKPYFFSFTETPSSDINIQGLRIGLNGREAPIGQAYANLNFTVTSADYNPEGVPLSDLGTVIALEKGPSQDQFFIGFDNINGQATQRPEVVAPVPEEAGDLPAQPRIGVRTFAEINASLSAMTGVPVTDAGVSSTFGGDDGTGGVQQQMPTDENINGFLVAHQMGVTQLAVKYCNVLATDDARMGQMFDGFNPAGDGFDETSRGVLIDGLLTMLVANTVAGEGVQLSNQPLVADSRVRLNDLITTMTSSCSGTCNNTITDNTVTAVCAAALGSAVMLVQ